MGAIHNFLFVFQHFYELVAEPDTLMKGQCSHLDPGTPEKHTHLSLRKVSLTDLQLKGFQRFCEHEADPHILMQPQNSHLEQRTQETKATTLFCGGIWF